MRLMLVDELQLMVDVVQVKPEKLPKISVLKKIGEIPLY